MGDYHIGYIFTTDAEDYEQIAQWCEQNKAMIRLNSETECEIVEQPLPTEEETKKKHRNDLLDFLTATDNYAIRLATGEAKAEDWSATYNCTFSEIMIKRKQAREELNNDNQQS